MGFLLKVLLEKNEQQNGLTTTFEMVAYWHKSDGRWVENGMGEKRSGENKAVTKKKLILAYGKKIDKCDVSCVMNHLRAL